MRVEIQTNGFNVVVDHMVKLVKDELKSKKILVTKVKNLSLYYIPEDKTVYYSGMYNNAAISGEIELTEEDCAK